ncbi:STAS-like domain-containing protein [Pseudomonas aeruginosa]|uniref:STAS-like domain-containing protein n=1 Tax=Pseudomonas aeruginosa TaxID=287 RepID=UPI0008FB50F7|nr:STAS-like domain-containing protein [Pseudomonas aeruginosa]EKU2242351.1 STAS-like domain-containing protein [Pseudomonas aeruginosa]EKV0215294.1 STAS-like domain-containing protein [Pseudomonas aeruginosa]EKX5072394.1 STAS-like domain-containing protein [Pseudomonas aeruginosa]ELC0887429.1 STAS-like domain-containing protein [Pseudomonas aeruginosa]ELS4619318.1 STAS-like domain-containing protein [Pseudomonas aeruginosa]
MKSEITIDVAKSFSDMPYGRNEKDGKFNGLAFRKLLLEKLSEYQKVKVDLNGTLGCGSSFTDEAFGGLVAYEGFKPEEVLERIEIIYRYDSIVRTIRKYIEDAKPAS